MAVLAGAQGGTVLNGFVQARGHALIDDSGEIQVVGANNYYLSYESRAMLESVLDGAVALGLNTLRTWAFLDCGARIESAPPAGNKNGIYFQCWDAGTQTVAYNDGPDGLERLDFVIDRASRRGLRLILTFVDNWAHFGGMDQYLAWFGVAGHDAFYDDERARQAFRNWMAHLVNRVNVYTGRAYRDEPAILAWELANEPRRLDQLSIRPWAREMSAYLKELDPRHLLAVGDEGFESVLDLDTIDIGTFHCYPETYFPDRPAAAEQWIQEHSGQSKPVLMTEYGLKNRLLRDGQYREWIELFRNNGGAGALVWMLAGRRDDGSFYPDYDGFTIYADAR